MFLRASTVAFLVTTLGALVAPASGAGTIEFQFEGVYTRVIGSVHQIGQTFTSNLVFNPSAVDVNPNPLIAAYGFIKWTAPSATNPIVFQNEDGSTAGIRIFRDLGSSEVWQLDFQGGSPNFFYRIALTFPLGTFPTEALPLNLDLTQASEKIYEASDGLFLGLEGNITSLTVVPEPTSALIISFGALLAGRGRRVRAT